MDLTPITTSLGGLETSFARKGFARPECDLNIKGNGRFVVWIWATGLDPKKPTDTAYKSFYGDTLEGAFAAAETWLAEQPEPEVKDLNTFQRMLADTIDFGNDKGIDTAPLVVVSQTIASNLLAYQAA